MHACTHTDVPTHTCTSASMCTHTRMNTQHSQSILLRSSLLPPTAPGVTPPHGHLEAPCGVLLPQGDSSCLGSFSNHRPQPASMEPPQGSRKSTGTWGPRGSLRGGARPWQGWDCTFLGRAGHSVDKGWKALGVPRTGERVAEAGSGCPVPTPLEQFFPESGMWKAGSPSRGLGVGSMPIGEGKAIHDEWHCQLPLPQVSPVWVSSAGILPPLHFSEWPRGRRSQASWWLRTQFLTLQHSQSPWSPGRGAPALSSSRWRTLRTSRIRPRNWPRNPAFLGWFWKHGHQKAQEDPGCWEWPVRVKAERCKAELGALASSP